MARIDGKRARVVLGLAAVTAGVASCALLGGIGDLPYPADASLGDGSTDGIVGADGGDAGPNGDAPMDGLGGGDSPVDAPFFEGGCDGGTLVCGGSCVDTRSNAQNCGRCAHDCQGGSCVGSTCQPFELTSAGDTPAGIAVYGGTVYWVDLDPGTVRVLSI